uniref:Aminotransferase class I/classII domain-containing protein n=1 Tax=Amphora coffeiformis TaxID=265554 RepID=A0A7S3PA58_9STRA
MVQAYPARGVSIVAMSKPWGACGITIGWIACKNLSMMDKLWNCHYFGTACMSRASELQARMVLRVSDAILQDRLVTIRHNKALLQKVIEQDYPDLLEWQRPTAGAICFCKFKGPLTSLELGNILAARGISIKPAYCFMDDQHQSGDDDDNDDLASYFRIGYGERCIPQALDAFVSVLEEYKDEWRVTMGQNRKEV